MQKPNDTNRQRFADVWDAIEGTQEDAAMMKALQDNQATPLGNSVIEKLRGGSRY